MRWGEDVLSLDFSEILLFRMGDSMLGFLLRAVYRTSLTTSLAVKWAEAKDGMGRLCRNSPAHLVRV